MRFRLVDKFMDVREPICVLGREVEVRFRGVTVPGNPGVPGLDESINKFLSTERTAPARQINKSGTMFLGDCIQRAHVSRKCYEVERLSSSFQSFWSSEDINWR